MTPDLVALLAAAESTPIRLSPAPLVSARHERTVLETPTSWTIPDSVLMQAGVYGNSEGTSTLREWGEIEKTGAFYDGVPIIYPHPPGPVVGPRDLRMVGGMVRNVRLDKVNRRVLGDYVLLKQEVDGFRPYPKAVELNAAAVQRYLSGQPLENSPGYLALIEKQVGTHEGAAFTERASNLIPNHLALLGVAGDHDPPACPWPVCGAGAAQKECRAQNDDLKGDAARNEPQETLIMADCTIPECKSKHESVNARALAAEGALGTIGELLGLKESKPAALIDAVRARAEKAASFDASEVKRVAAEGVRHESLLTDVVKIQSKLDKDADVKALRESFAKWPLAALETHKTSLEAAIRGMSSGRDATRAGAVQESDAQTQAATGAPVGKANGYGGYTVDWGALPKTGGRQ